MLYTCRSLFCAHGKIDRAIQCIRLRHTYRLDNPTALPRDFGTYRSCGHLVGPYIWGRLLECALFTLRHVISGHSIWLVLILPTSTHLTRQTRRFFHAAGWPISGKACGSMRGEGRIWCVLGKWTTSPILSQS